MSDKTTLEEAQELALFLHVTYETLAPQFGYETRKETREFDPNSPNGMLMIATAGAILNQFSQRTLQAENEALKASERSARMQNEELRREVERLEAALMRQAENAEYRNHLRELDAADQTAERE